jgi:hypothetical protein
VSAEDAEWHIREINEAWEVLRSPAARAAYDRQTRAVTAPAVSGAGATSVPWRSPTPTWSGPLVDPVAESAPGAPRAGGRGRRWAPVLIVVGTLALLAVVVLVATHHSSGAGRYLKVQTDHYPDGSCVVVSQDVGGGSIVSVPCTQVHTGKVVATTRDSRDCPTSADTFVAIDGRDVVCLSTGP